MSKSCTESRINKTKLPKSASQCKPKERNILRVANEEIS